MSDNDDDNDNINDNINEKDIGDNVVAISISKRNDNGSIVVGVSYLKGKKINIFEFNESTQQLCSLESLLVRLSPNRCYFPSTNTLIKVGHSIEKNLQSLLNMIGIKLCLPIQDSLSLIKKMDNIEQDLRLLTGMDSSSLTPLMGLKEAIKSLIYLINEESLLGRQSDEDESGNLSNFLLSIGKMDQFMKLDSAAINALHIFPSSIPGSNSSNENNNNSSIHGILNKCRTKKLGSRLLSQWLRQPLRDINEINKRQTFVSLFVDNPTCRNGIRDALGHTPDIEFISKRFLSKKANLIDLYKLYIFTTNTIPKLIEMLNSLEISDDEATIKPILDEFHKFDTRLNEYKNLVERILDFKYAPREFRVLPSCDETSELQSLSEDIQNIDSKVQDIREKLENDELKGMIPKFESDEKALKTYGYHFRISKKFDTQLMKVADKDTHYLTVVATGIRWTTPKLTKLWNEHQDLLQQYHTAQTVIVKDTCDMALLYLPIMESAASLCAELDVLCSFAHVAATSPAGSFIRPVMIDTNINNNNDKDDIEIFISQGRHPCLELQDLESHQDFIPNNYKFGKLKDRFQIITGPNMGGKSTYIRTLGILCVMAQIGSFIPCEEAKLPILDAVLARVGASDAQLRGVSTFMAEMLEASAILQTATKNSLVIIDELGRGTSTYDGFGLAWGISSKLAKDIGCFGLFATHFHEMTTLENEISCVCNKHVTAIENNGNVTMLYSVKNGPCLNSFGIPIAKLAKFPDDVLDAAQEKASQLETFAKHDNDQSESKRKKYENDDESKIQNELMFLQHFVNINGSEDVNIMEKTKSLLSKHQLKITS